MPLYDYKCKECDAYFESNKSVDDRDIAECPCGGSGGRVFLSFPSILYKGSGWTKSVSNTESDRVMQRIRTASATDADIAYVQKEGTPAMYGEMVKEANRLHKEKAHLDRIYGKDTFDGKDRNGNLVKNMPLSFDNSK